jgi:hypothetical protein
MEAAGCRTLSAQASGFFRLCQQFQGAAASEPGGTGFTRPGHAPMHSHTPPLPIHARIGRCPTRSRPSPRTPASLRDKAMDYVVIIMVGAAATLSLETAPSCLAPRNFFFNHRR